MKVTTKRTLATALCGILALTAVAGAGTALYMGAKENGWFKKDTEVEENVDEASIDNVVVSEGASSAKLSISSSRTASLSSSIVNGSGATAEYVEDSITLTANYNSDATSPSFTWTTSNSAVTLTPSSDTKSCVVTCNSAFSSQVTIKCIADDDEDVYATCTVDYIKRATNAALTITNVNGGDDLTWSSNSSTATWTLPTYNSTYYQPTGVSGCYKLELGSFTPTLGTGTISETYTLTSLGYSVTPAGSSATRSYDITDSAQYYYYILYAYSGYYANSTANVKEMYSVIDGKTYSITMTFTGDTTGLEYTYTYNIKIDASNLYTAISSVSLNNSALAF
ncbi:MAG: hypothetical protein LUD27_01000 [Clostridia bacterium]|nr:hypothetical protein [Clostridia bacterium]